MDVEIITPLIEQGTITSSGNSSSTTNIRSTEYLYFDNILAPIKSITITVVSAIGKDIQVELLGYTSDTTTSRTLDLYWYDNNYVFDIASYATVKYFRIVLKHSDGSNITPSDIVSCSATLEYEYNWHIGTDGFPTNDLFPNMPTDVMIKPYPKALWRIEQGENNGFPYHELYPNVDTLGAFSNAIRLRKISIPPSVKKIGRYAFTNTQLSQVTIASDCEYYDTSFPAGCVITFYPD